MSTGARVDGKSQEAARNRAEPGEARNGKARTGLLTVIMPVHNERATLRPVLDRVMASPVEKEVILVDDASTDGTAELIRNEIEGRYPNLRALYIAENAGKGAAIRAAIPHARGDYILIQDGDLEYDPEDYPALLRPFQEQGASIVYGSRFMKARPRMRLPNRMVNWLLARMVRMLYGAPLTDEATCYKVFRRELLQSMPLTCRRFEFCPEVTAKALRRGYRIVEVPIHYQARSMAEGKKIRWTDGVQAIWTLIKYRFWR
jgi:glycosyltransferase involved in cell wall biosynthesis